MRSRLAIWDDDESDEVFYLDRYVVLLKLDLEANIQAFALFFNQTTVAPH